jgi:3-phosphoshikimate 1-carboxyvinyltransferase
MEKLIRDAHTGDILDAHHAGTTFRFMTAFLALTTTKQIVLTGSTRMQQRPIKALVDALNALGADIKYQIVEGFPPLIINKSTQKWAAEISLPADISSQYISALLMIAPYLPDGLKLNLDGEVVSKPYIDMTIAMMKNFGVSAMWMDDNCILVPKGTYQPIDYYVEADWSSASYFYSIAALAKSADLTIHGLIKNSLQGDSVVSSIYKSLGIETIFGDQKIHITKAYLNSSPFIEQDFIQCPDLTQTVAVTLAGLGVSALYSGLQTLYIKETDRVAALSLELSKFGILLTKLPSRFSSKSGKLFYSQEGKAKPSDTFISVQTYNDHRMAMAFAPLACLFEIHIKDPEVVSKSYPSFWSDLKRIGFEISISQSADE